MVPSWVRYHHYHIHSPLSQKISHLSGITMNSVSLHTTFSETNLNRLFNSPSPHKYQRISKISVLPLSFIFLRIVSLCRNNSFFTIVDAFTMMTFFTTDISFSFKFTPV